MKKEERKDGGLQSGNPEHQTFRWTEAWYLGSAKEGIELLNVLVTFHNLQNACGLGGVLSSSGCDFCC